VIEEGEELGTGLREGGKAGSRSPFLLLLLFLLFLLLLGRGGGGREGGREGGRGREAVAERGQEA